MAVVGWSNMPIWIIHSYSWRYDTSFQITVSKFLGVGTGHLLGGARCQYYSGTVCLTLVFFRHIQAAVFLRMGTGILNDPHYM